MIQGIRQIGEIVRREKTVSREILESMTEEVPRVNVDGKPLLCVIDIRPNEKKIIMDWDKQIDERVAEEYLWLGSAASNAPQDRLTVNLNNLRNLLSHTIPYLMEKNISDDFKSKLGKIYPGFYYDSGSSKFRYRYFLNLSELKGISKSIWKEIISSTTNDPKKRAKKLAEAFLKEQNVPKEVGLFTLAIDGEVLVKEHSYQDYLFNAIVENYFLDGKEGVCHLCGKKKQTTWDMAKIKKINLFINQKINFASGVLEKEKGFRKNYVLCKDCYLDLLVGENEIVSKFSQNVLHTDTYLIPELANPKEINIKGLERVSQELRKHVNGLANISKVPDILDLFGSDQGYTRITLLFGRKVQAGLKVIEVVPEVPPSRIEEIIKATNESLVLANKFWGERDGGLSWLRGLEDLLYVLPIPMIKKRQQKIRQPDTAPALRMFREIVLGEIIKLEVLVKEFLKVIRAIYYANPSYYITRNASTNEYRKNIDKMLCDYLLASLTFLNFVRRLGILQERKNIGGDIMKDAGIYEDVIKEFQFDAQRKALFLLGVLVARVGSAQWKASSSGKKNVLEKINYQGMDFRKVLLFSNELFDKLRQYKLLDTDTEKIFGAAKELLDHETNRWALSSQENVYYLLSGYAHETRRIIIEAGDKKNKQKDEETEEG